MMRFRSDAADKKLFEIEHVVEGMSDVSPCYIWIMTISTDVFSDFVNDQQINMVKS